ncbi:alpha-glucosidase maltase [Actinomortierella ambigua]|nr:alpha-glucosidase maltase [Actinomortierella ambigua]
MYSAIQRCCPDFIASMLSPTTHVNKASIKHYPMPPPQKQRVSPRTPHPAEYHVEAIHPALGPTSSTSSSTSPSPPATQFPLDQAHTLDLALTQPAELDPEYGTDCERVRVTVDPISPTCLGVTIEPRDRRAWRVPEHVVPRHRPRPRTRHGQQNVPSEEDRQDRAFDLQVFGLDGVIGTGAGTGAGTDADVDPKPDPFAFVVKHRATGETIFDTTQLGMVIRDQYLEISTWLGGGLGSPEEVHPIQELEHPPPGGIKGQDQTGAGGASRKAYVYGLGENVGRFRRPVESVSTMWARDCPCKPDHNLYGCQPFYVEVLPESGTVHGVLLLNSNGMDVSLCDEKQHGGAEGGRRGDSVMTYKVIGGVLEFYFFTGPTLHDVIQQYTALVGRPALTPYWVMGNHQCRWGYKTLEAVQQVVDNFNTHQIPLEAMWVDIDYMDAYKCFTLDKERFPVKDVAEFTQKLHAQDQHLVMILDPGIKLQYEPGRYLPYDDGVAKNLFIKRRVQNDDQEEEQQQQQEEALVDFIGKVWPGLTVFPDWFHPEAQAYWTEHVTRWVKEIGLDGIWIDMNEIASFHSGDASALVRREDDRPVRMSDFTIQPKKVKKDEDKTGKTKQTEGSDKDDDGGEVIVQPQHQQEESSGSKKATTTKTSQTVEQDNVEVGFVKKATEDEDEDEDVAERPQDAVADEDEEEEEEEREAEAAAEPSSKTAECPRSVVSMASIQAEACGIGAADLLGDKGSHGALERKEDQDTRPPVVYTNVNHPPYRINNNNEQASLDYRTVSADALHHHGVLEYDVHNLYGHMESMATYQALRTAYPDRKPFVLSRSTFVGTGQYASHWLGDNRSHWYDLRVSIAGLLNFQLFGVPMVGSDVGGFGDPATEELLIRWHQLGAFYPFMRNHNCMGLPAQEPYLTPRLARVTRHHLDLRYRLLPYWYTLFQRAHLDGDPVCAPLWSLNAHPAKDLLDVDEQFLVGRAILVSPALYERQRIVRALFPPGLWYALESGVVEVVAVDSSPVGKTESATTTTTTTVELSSPLESMPVHVRGGSILPMCGLPKGTFLRTTKQVRDAGLELVAALDGNGLARGEALVDDDRLDVQEASQVVMEVATPGVLRVECKPLLVDEDEVEENGRSRKAKTVVIQSIVIWGVGLDLGSLFAPGAVGQRGGKVPPSLQKSLAQVDIRQVRLSRVAPVAEAEMRPQHVRELAAVDLREMHVEWDSQRAQLTVRIKGREPGAIGGLELRGGEGLELDWTEAVMA